MVSVSSAMKPPNRLLSWSIINVMDSLFMSVSNAQCARPLKVVVATGSVPALAICTTLAAASAAEITFRRSSISGLFCVAQLNRPFTEVASLGRPTVVPQPIFCSCQVVNASVRCWLKPPPITTSLSKAACPFTKSIVSVTPASVASGSTPSVTGI